MSQTFKNAVNTKVTGNPGSKSREYELNFIPKVIRNLNNIKKHNAYHYMYVECLPVGVISSYFRGLTFRNNFEALCKVENVWLKDNKVLLDVSTNDSRYRVKKWTMSLATMASSAHQLNYKKLQEKYFIPVTKNNVDSLIAHLNEKMERYNNQYIESIQEASDIINEKVASYENNMVVTRKAIQRAILSVRKDAQVVADAFNSILTIPEQEKLISYLKKNIYSMRLYAVKGTEWDQALTEMYPDEKYGLKRRTEATENSKNTIGGYISVNSIQDAPLDIIQKITHKVDKNASFIQNKGSTKYRLNNYMLVLFLLNNYNKDGFVTGKTNLYKVIN